MIEVKRVYEAADEEDGFRILVDRLWPRGLSKNEARIDLWLKEIAPSDGLRRWFAHDPKRWREFKERYFAELDRKSELVNLIVGKANEGKVTLLYGAKNEQFNNAVALKEYIETRMKVKP